MENKINHKIYIGKTNNFKKRKIEHTKVDINDNTLFHKALKKYGLENFNWEIIDWADTLEEINVLEKKYIEQFRSFKPNGYNMTKGGDGGSMWNARPVICLTLDGEYVKRYDSAGEAERIDGFCNSSVLQSCKSKNITCRNHIFMFEDDFLKYGPRKYQKPNYANKRKVVQCDLDGNYIMEFESVKVAAQLTGIPRPQISSVITGKHKSAYGYIFVYKEDFPIKNIQHYKHNKKGIKIIQVDPNTNEYINEYDRISDAGKTLGVSYKAIHKVLDRPNRTAYGYKWIRKHANTEVINQIAEG